MDESSKNHKKAPIAAQFVKEMREVFGDDQVEVLYVKEGKFQLGDLDAADAD